MTTERRSVSVGGVSVEIIRKDIKNLHVGVYPPEGRVRVAAPMRLDDDAVRFAVASRLRWIRRQQSAFAQQERQSQREMVTGESHYFGGRRYLLDVIAQEGPASIDVVNNTTIVLRVRPGTDRATRARALEEWYRSRLKDQLPSLLSRWEQRVGVTVADTRIRKMKTRWGSCNAEVGRVWLNLELAKKPPLCLEYVLVHELVHFLERRHTRHFRDLLDGIMPAWRLARDELNHAPLAHEEWLY